MKSIIISIIQILFLVSPVSASERETDYIVTFYPESGSILQNISCKIVFTAEGIDKKKISITGVIINERGDTVQSVKTLLPGIGYFHIYANPGERYILKCENRDRIRKNFYLPMMSENGFGLKIIENKEQWLLSVINSSREVPMKLLYLVAQSEDSIFFQKVWNPKDSYLVFDKKHFPKGISSFALVDSMKNLLCGRVVLNIQEQTDFQSLPPDFRMGLLPLKNQIDSDPSRLSLAWDLIAMKLEDTTNKNLSQPNPDIWKTVNLDEVSIIASMRRKQKYNGLYSGSLPSSRVIYRQNIEQWHIQDMRSLLYLLGSVNISWYVVDHVYKECVFIQDYGAISFQTDPVKNYEPPLFVVDDVPYQNYDILSFPVTEIEEIFILKGVDAAIYGPKGKRGIIVVTTKRNKPPYEK